MWSHLPAALSLLTASTLPGADLAQVINSESRGSVSSTSSDLNQFTFHFLKDLKIAEPDRVLDPDRVQSFFTLNPKVFLENEGKDNFLDAKESYYRKLKYSFKTKNFLQPQTTLTDWGGLNHPPLHEILPEDLNWITKPSASPAPGERNTPEFHQSLDQLSGSGLTIGNTFKPLWDRAVLNELIQIVNHTEKTLFGSALLFACDSSTDDLLNALNERADHGVDIRIMVDQTMQSLQQGHCVKKLRDHGIKVVLVPGMITHGSAFHVKLWASDFRQGLLLGANLIDVQTLSTGFNHLFHDSGLSIEGPVVTDIAERFMDLWSIYQNDTSEDWKAHGDQIRKIKQAESLSKLRGVENYQDWLKSDVKTPSGLCRVVVQERHGVRDRVSQTLGAYLKTASSRVWFNSVRRDFHKTAERRTLGYNELLMELFEKSKRDQIDVEMMFNAGTNPYSPYSVRSAPVGKDAKPGIFNALMRAHLNHSTNTALKDGSVFFENAHQEAPRFRAWSYFTYSHIKTLIMDNDFVVTGSYNPLDERSTDDAEIALFCQDQALNSAYSLGFARDLVNSVPYPYSSQFSE